MEQLETYSIVERWDGSFYILLQGERNKPKTTRFWSPWNPGNLCAKNFSLLREEGFECIRSYFLSKISNIHFMGAVNELGLFCLKKWYVRL